MIISAGNLLLLDRYKALQEDAWNTFSDTEPFCAANTDESTFKHAFWLGVNAKVRSQEPGQTIKYDETKIDDRTFRYAFALGEKAGNLIEDAIREGAFDNAEDASEKKPVTNMDKRDKRTYDHDFWLKTMASVREKVATSNIFGESVTK